MHLYLRSGDLNAVIGLRTTSYLANEDEWAPWFAADQTLAYVSLMLSKTLAFGKYKAGDGLNVKNSASADHKFKNRILAVIGLHYFNVALTKWRRLPNRNT